MLHLRKTWNKLHCFLHEVRVIVYSTLGRLIPLQNKIVFCNHGGDGFGDDPKYIVLELLKRKTKIKLVWMLTDSSEPLPKGVVAVKYASPEAIFHLHTAKVWVYNYRNDFKVVKRRGQYYIQCWHGSISSKMVEQDAEDTLPIEYVNAAKKDGSMTDLMYSNNAFKIELFKNRFWYNGVVIRSDSPQLSILINPTEDIRYKVYNYFQVPTNMKLVLYAPTLQSSIEVFRYDYERVMAAIEKRFGGQFIMLFRLHPSISGMAKCITYPKNIIDATLYPDMAELLSTVDVLISDFSGVMFDMGMIKKPVFMYSKNYDDYIVNNRRQYFSPERLPFDIAKTEDDLITHILNFNQDKYEKRLRCFFDEVGLIETGHGAEHIAKIIENRIDNITSAIQ